MGIAEELRKRKEAGKEHTVPPPRDHTVSEILQDKNNSHLFGKLLERDGKEELAARVATGNLEQDDIDLLSEYRIKFSEKIAQSEKIEKLLTEENVIEIARTHPDFAKIIDIVTPKQAIKVIQRQLRGICFTDEYRFNAIAGPIETLDSYKNGAYKQTNDRVEKFCKDNQITQKEYLDAIAIEDPMEKEKALRALSSRTYSNFKKVVNVFSLGKWAKNTTLQGLKESETSLEDSITELDGYKSDIGNMLFSSIGGNDDMRNALSRELLSESAPKAEPKTGFSDAKKETVIFDENGFDGDWEAFKVKMDYNGSNDFEKGWLQEKFIDDQKRAYQEKNKNVKNKGFWHSILAAVFEGKINSKRDTLK
ncbi:MAG: hypothetical protein AAB786_01835 [Patescibacteria group bacterium]|mgnify:CR=1 FL=1